MAEHMRPGAASRGGLRARTRFAPEGGGVDDLPVMMEPEPGVAPPEARPAPGGAPAGAPIFQGPHGPFAADEPEEAAPQGDDEDVMATMQGIVHYMHLSLVNKEGLGEVLEALETADCSEMSSTEAEAYRTALMGILIEGFDPTTASAEDADLIQQISLGMGPGAVRHLLERDPDEPEGDGGEGDEQEAGPAGMAWGDEVPAGQGHPVDASPAAEDNAAHAGAFPAALKAARSARDKMRKAAARALEGGDPDAPVDGSDQTGDMSSQATLLFHLFRATAPALRSFVFSFVRKMGTLEALSVLVCMLETGGYAARPPEVPVFRVTEGGHLHLRDEDIMEAERVPDGEERLAKMRAMRETMMQVFGGPTLPGHCLPLYLPPAMGGGPVPFFPVDDVVLTQILVNMGGVGPVYIASHPLDTKCPYFLVLDTDQQASYFENPPLAVLLYGGPAFRQGAIISVMLACRRAGGSPVYLCTSYMDFSEMAPLFQGVTGSAPGPRIMLPPDLCANPECAEGNLYGLRSEPALVMLDLLGYLVNLIFDTTNREVFESERPPAGEGFPVDSASDRAARGERFRQNMRHLMLRLATRGASSMGGSLVKVSLNNRNEVVIDGKVIGCLWFVHDQGQGGDGGREWPEGGDGETYITAARLLAMRAGPLTPGSFLPFVAMRCPIHYMVDKVVPGEPKLSGIGETPVMTAPHFLVWLLGSRYVRLQSRVCLADTVLSIVGGTVPEAEIRMKEPSIMRELRALRVISTHRITASRPLSSRCGSVGLSELYNRSARSAEGEKLLSVPLGPLFAKTRTPLSATPEARQALFMRGMADSESLVTVTLMDRQVGTASNPVSVSFQQAAITGKGSTSLLAQAPPEYLALAGLLFQFTRGSYYSIAEDLSPLREHLSPSEIEAVALILTALNTGSCVLPPASVLSKIPFLGDLDEVASSHVVYTATGTQRTCTATDSISILFAGKDDRTEGTWRIHVDLGGLPVPSCVFMYLVVLVTGCYVRRQMVSRHMVLMCSKTAPSNDDGSVPVWPKGSIHAGATARGPRAGGVVYSEEQADFGLTLGFGISADELNEHNIVSKTFFLRRVLGAYRRAIAENDGTSDRDLKIRAGRMAMEELETARAAARTGAMGAAAPPAPAVSPPP